MVQDGWFAHFQYNELGMKQDRKHSAGKGDTYRRVDKKKYDKNYDRIFKKGRVKS